MMHKQCCNMVRIKDKMVLKEGKECKFRCDCWCHLIKEESIGKTERSEE